MAAAREALVERIRQRLSAESYPRLTVLAALIVSGAAAAGFSAVGLRLGFTAMAARYGCAAVVGYAAFLGCIRLWIAYASGRLIPGRSARLSSGPSRSGVDLVDLLPDGSWSPTRGAALERAPAFFAGGHSGGGGGGASFGSAVTADPGGGALARAGVSSGHSGATNALGDLVDGIDLDSLKWLLLALAAALSALIAVGWIVYVAPVMLAEVAVNAALVGAAYRRLRRDRVESWEAAVFRRTWIPASVVVVMMTVMGWALHEAAPGAHSIGAVVRAVFGS